MSAGSRESVVSEAFPIYFGLYQVLDWCRNWVAHRRLPGHQTRYGWMVEIGQPVAARKSKKSRFHCSVWSKWRPWPAPFDHLKADIAAACSILLQHGANLANHGLGRNHLQAGPIRDDPHLAEGGEIPRRSVGDDDVCRPVRPQDLRLRIDFDDLGPVAVLAGQGVEVVSCHGCSFPVRLHEAMTGSTRWLVHSVTSGPCLVRSFSSPPSSHSPPARAMARILDPPMTPRARPRPHSRKPSAWGTTSNPATP